MRKYGKTRRGWLGVRIQTITPDLADSLGLDKPEGALVADVTATGPAEAAGIKAGDVIVSFDGRKVLKMSDLPRIVARTPVGKKVVVGILRSGKSMDIEVKLGRLEDGEKLIAKNGGSSGRGGSAPAETEVLGMKLSAMSDELRRKFKIGEGVKGLVVVSVDPSGPAAEKGIVAGDVIAEAGEKEMASPADFVKRMKEVKAEGRGSILLLVLKTSRNGDPRFIALKLK